MIIGRIFHRNETDWRWLQASGFLFVLSIILAIWKGPFWIYGCSGIGLAISLIALVLGFLRPDKNPKKSLLFAGLVAHILMLAAGLFLETSFLRPLSDEILKIPRIGHSYSDPDGHFSLKGPIEWQYETIHASDGAGVKIRPVLPESYTGVAEIQVWVRHLEETPPSGIEFIDRMARALAGPARSEGSDSLFTFSTKPAELMSNDPGIFSILDIKKLWIPLRQITLFGLKDQRVLISVSTTGLAKDSRFFEVICLGVFETISISRYNH